MKKLLSFLSISSLGVTSILPITEVTKNNIENKIDISVGNFTSLHQGSWILYSNFREL